MRMNTTAILVRGTALLLTGMHSLIGYTQTDDGSNEDADGVTKKMTDDELQTRIDQYRWLPDYPEFIEWNEAEQDRRRTVNDEQ